ncbi:MAG: ankyrin repeat domain-containing protein [Francisellaceae bacterium]|nr:ankyrin repeat domain-containing protein [Francisellaceae bacterium]
MTYISSDKFNHPILKKIAAGDESVFLDADGNDFNVMDSQSIFSSLWRSLSLACNNGHGNIVNRLLKIPDVAANAAEGENRALTAAIICGDEDIVSRLLEVPSVAYYAAFRSNLTLRLAAKLGHIRLVERILEVPGVADSAADDNNLILCSAAECGHAHVINKLLEIPSVIANASARNNFILYWAARNGHAHIVGRLLKIPDIAVNAATQDNLALFSAVENGHVETSYVLARFQWPRGVIDMPDDLHQWLPEIYQGALISSGKQEFKAMVKCWIKGNPTRNTSDVHYPRHSGLSQKLMRVDRYNAPRTIMQYAGCGDVVTEVDAENRVDYGMKTLLYSAHLHRTFQAAYEHGQKENMEHSGYGEDAMTIYSPCVYRNPGM